MAYQLPAGVLKRQTSLNPSYVSTQCSRDMSHAVKCFLYPGPSVFFFMGGASISLWVDNNDEIIGDLQNCDLVGSDLQHSNLRGANIAGTNLQDVVI